MQKNKCEKCGQECKTARGLSIHKTRVHPYRAPVIPPPVKTTEMVKPSLLEDHNLLNGRKLELGDVFYRVEKHVIKSITYTEGSETVNVKSERITNNWQQNKPQ